MKITLSTANVDVLFDRSSTDLLTQVAGRLGMSAQALLDTINQQATQFVRAKPDPVFPNDGFWVQRGTDGLLTPVLRFEQLNVVQVIDFETLGLFGIMLTDRHDLGNASLRTAGDLDLSEDMAICVSPATFRRLVFGPASIDKFDPSIRENIETILAPEATETQKHFDQRKKIVIAEALHDTALTRLPPCCGTAGSVSMSLGRLTRLCDEFHNGWIAIDGNGEKEDDCYTATFSFKKEIQLNFTTGPDGTTQLNQVQTMPLPPVIHVDVDWWCELIPVVLGGAFSFVFPGLEIAGNFFSAAADDFATIFGQRPADKRETDSKAPPTFAGLRLDQVAIHEDGLVFQGTVKVDLPAAEAPDIEIVTKATNIGIPVRIGSGTYHFPGGYHCGPADFDYEEMAVSQSFALTVVAQNLPPITGLTWTLVHVRRSTDVLTQPQVTDSVVLTGASGTVTLRVDSTEPSPPPFGVTFQDHPAEIDYEISGNSLILRTRADDAQFTVGVLADVLLTGGLPMSTGTSIDARGHVLIFPPDYDQYVQQCALQDAMDAAHESLDPGSIPRGGDPIPWQLAAAVSQELLSDVQQASVLKAVAGQLSNKGMVNGGLAGTLIGPIG